MSEHQLKNFPTYHYNDVALAHAPLVTLLASLGVISLYEGPERQSLFLSLIGLTGIFYMLHRVVLPRVRTVLQLDAVVFAYYSIIAVITTGAVLLYPHYLRTAGMVMISVMVGIYFTSRVVAALVVVVLALAWLAAAYAVTGTVDTRDVLQLLVFTPSAAIILRLSVGRTHQALNAAREGETETVKALQATLQHLNEERQLREASESELLHARKTESLGMLAAGVSHDFNNALLAISAFAENIRTLTSDEAAKQHAGEIVKAVHQASSVCEQMMTYAGKAPEKHGPVNLGDLAVETLPLLKAAAGNSTAVNMLNRAGDAMIRATAPQLQQVMINLVTNAAEAMDGAGAIKVIVERLLFKEDLSNVPEGAFGAPILAGTYYQLSVIDVGEGMSEETQLQMFDPYFTTRKTGHGFGLSTVLGIMRSHNATMIVNSEPGQGTTFQLLFPAFAEDMADSKVFRIPKSPVARRTDGRRLLLVDDEALVRTPMAEMVRLLGWDVVEANGGPAAIDEAKHDSKFSIVMIDYRMPDMNGVETLRALRQTGVVAPAILCSGYISEPQERVLREFDGFLMKPFRRRQLEDQLHSVMKFAKFN